MSQNFLLPGPGEAVWPAHSELCLESCDNMCADCYTLLAPHPRRRWREIYRQHYCRRRGLPDPLSLQFMDRLRATLALEPERYAPIIQFLSTYERKES